VNLTTFNLTGGFMRTLFVKDYDEMTKVTYDIVKETLRKKPAAVLSMTTGGSPRGLIETMVEEINNGQLDISEATIMNLDEYVGPKHASYTVDTFMNENFYKKIKKQPKRAFLIDGSADDIDSEIARYTGIMDQYPRDIQILGLGTNGHIGANEPGTPFDSTIFLAQHDNSTIQSTMREYNLTCEEAPTQMITMGFTEILEAETVILMVSGKRKAEAVKDLLEGEVTVDCPASYLRDKSNVIMIVDEEAAALLSR